MQMTTQMAIDLTGIRLFRRVGRSLLRQLEEKSEIEIIVRDTIIVTEGDRLDSLNIVGDGVVELFASSPTNRKTIALLKPGDSFILAAVIHNAVALMSARSVGRTRVLRIPAGLYRRALNSDHRLMSNALMEVAREFRGMVRHLRDQKLRTADQRLAGYLMRLGLEQGNEREMVLPVSKQLIASYLGIRSESLSRAFSDLQRIGVFVEGERVRIADPVALAQFASIDQLIDNSAT